MTRRAVLDSNVIVSGLGWSGATARIIEAVLAGELVLVTSSPSLAELRRVLAYPKLAVKDHLKMSVDDRRKMWVGLRLVGWFGGARAGVVACFMWWCPRCAG